VYPGRPVVCPTCGANLQPSTRRGRLEALIGLCFSVAICYLLGLSREWFLVTTILLWFPVFVVCGYLLGRIVPPVFEAFDPQTGHLPKLISLDLHDPASTAVPEPGDRHDSGKPDSIR
jgi:hypothetical protein